MKWRKGTKSDNIEDRRSAGIPIGAVGGIGGLILLILIILISMFTGVDPTQIIQGTPGPTGPTGQSQLSNEQQNQSVEFVSLVLGDTEVIWTETFRDELGRTYIDPKLVLFTGAVQSACGLTSASVGPFYCPGDQKIYLDLSFLNDLNQSLGAPGDFAKAYVIAHEVGHHVQTLIGTTDYMDTLSSQASQTEADQLSVAYELQADCYAGVWANRSSHRDLVLENIDIQEGLNAASAVGDDRLQMESQGYIVPDSFTHGTSAQRMEWFSKGLDSGNMSSCNCPEFPPVE